MKLLQMYKHPIRPEGHYVLTKLYGDVYFMLGTRNNIVAENMLLELRDVRLDE